jgi:hypothetical protein
MENTFEIGEIVVCVDARRNWYKLGGLKKNEMYTVVGFNPYDNGLILKEVKSPGSGYNAFAAERFRKVDYNFSENVLEELQPQAVPQIGSELQTQNFINSNLN